MDSLPLDLRVKIAQHTCEPDVRIVSHLASVDRAFRKTVMQPVFWSAPFRGSELLIRHHPNPYSDMMESQLLELELDLRSIPAARVFPRLQTLKVFQTTSRTLALSRTTCLLMLTSCTGELGHSTQAAHVDL